MMPNFYVWHGQRIYNEAMVAATLAAEIAAERLLADANNTIPYDTGTMMKSGKVEPDYDNNGAVISYATHYVVRQHEDTNIRHPAKGNPNSKPGGRARWLELTAKENQPKTMAIFYKMFNLNFWSK
jgi:hypothetical protein